MLPASGGDEEDNNKWNDIIIKEGPLKKYNALWKEWVRYWFALTDSELLILEEDKDYEHPIERLRVDSFLNVEESNEVNGFNLLLIGRTLNL